jgi:hypothetical protein
VEFTLGSPVLGLFAIPFILNLQLFRPAFSSILSINLLFPMKIPPISHANFHRRSTVELTLGIHGC